MTSLSKSSSFNKVCPSVVLSIIKLVLCTFADIYCYLYVTTKTPNSAIFMIFVIGHFGHVNKK